MPQDFHLYMYGRTPLAINLNPYVPDIVNIVAGRADFFHFLPSIFFTPSPNFVLGWWICLNEK